MGKHIITVDRLKLLHLLAVLEPQVHVVELITLLGSQSLIVSLDLVTL